MANSKEKLDAFAPRPLPPSANEGKEKKAEGEPEEKKPKKGHHEDLMDKNKRLRNEVKNATDMDIHRGVHL